MHKSLKLVVIGLFFLTACTPNNGKGDIAYGDTLFSKSCSPCHAEIDMPDKTPGLLTFYDYDSLTLLRKLRQIKNDSVHVNYLKSMGYSTKEVNSICAYIKNYFKPRY
jgi:hypothetical protein